MLKRHYGFGVQVFVGFVCLTKTLPEGQGAVRVTPIGFKRTGDGHQTKESEKTRQG